MTKKELERRSYSFEVTAEDTEKGSVITGRPIVYNSRTNIGGMFEEIIEPGALDKADLTDVRFLVNHDMSKIPLARSRRNNGNSTMQLTVDNNGLNVKVILDTENNSEARALYSAVKRGDISGMSFLFGVSEGGDEWERLDTNLPLRHVRSISSVVEVSAVTFPAYDVTEINARSKGTLEEARAAIDEAKRSQENEKIDELELEKLKTRALELRFNHYHDSKGRFSSGKGSGSGSSSGGSSGGGNSESVTSSDSMITATGNSYEDANNKAANKKKAEKEAVDNAAWRSKTRDLSTSKETIESVDVSDVGSGSVITTYDKISGKTKITATARNTAGETLMVKLANSSEEGKRQVKEALKKHVDKKAVQLNY